MQPKTAAKDFFIFLAGFATLYASAISLIRLLFAIVNKAFPDALNSSYYYGSYDPYSTGLRLAIASLVIIFPVYLAIAWYLNGYLRRNPEKKELGVRKWLTYLTLFLTAIAVVSDLVVLVNTFLGGEITTRFVLKVLSVLVVAGGVFWYYVYDLKKSFAPDMPDRSKLLTSLAALAVLVSLVGGFALLGSPMRARAQKFDDRRVSDLSSIQSYLIYSYWQQKGSLPATLSELNDPISGFMVPVDPETGAQYGYEKSSDKNSFKLCADFKLSSNDKKGARPTSQVYPGMSQNENWKHGSGRQCFDRVIDPELYPVREAAAVRKY